MAFRRILASATIGARAACTQLSLPQATPSCSPSPSTAYALQYWRYLQVIRDPERPAFLRDALPDGRIRPIARSAPPDWEPPVSKADREAWVTTFDSRPVDIMRLSGEVFGAEIRKDIVQRVVVWQLAKRRAGTASCKGRSQIRGSTRKIYAQKGSGRARHSSPRANIFRGGGKAHGPVPRDFSYTLPRKVRALGLKIALSAKAAEGNLAVIDSGALSSLKTKEFSGILQERNWTSVLFLDVNIDKNLALASRNLQYVDVLPTRGANVYDILRRSTLVMTRAAVRELEFRLLRTYDQMTMLAPAQVCEGDETKLLLNSQESASSS